MVRLGVDRGAINNFFNVAAYAATGIVTRVRANRCMEIVTRIAWAFLNQSAFLSGIVVSSGHNVGSQADILRKKTWGSMVVRIGGSMGDRGLHSCRTLFGGGQDNHSRSVTAVLRV